MRGKLTKVQYKKEGGEWRDLEHPKTYPSIKEMCQFIVDHDIFTKKFTPREIYESSPSGELFQVFNWYDYCWRLDQGEKK